jgi:hypothetical protein
MSCALTGFKTIRREGIQLTVAFTATVNADLAVGELQKTVSGSAPLVVDAQNMQRQTVLSSTVMDALPTGTRSLSLQSLASCLA